MESVRVRTHEGGWVIQTGLTIHDQNILPAELEGHSVQLFANVLTPGGALGLRN